MTTTEQDNMNRDDKICNLCDTKTVSVLATCVDCDIQMCEICTKAHTRVKLTKDHKIAYNGRTELKKTHHSKPCSVHSGEDVTFYCYTCNGLICPHCITGTHKGHRCTVIKAVAQEISGKLALGLENFKSTKIAVMKSKIAGVKNLQSENENVGKHNSQNIEKRKDELLNAVQDVAERYLNQNSTTTRENEQNLSKVHVNLKNKFTEMERSYTEHSAALDSDSGIDVIIAFLKMQEGFDLSFDIPSVNEPNVPLNRFLPGSTSGPCLLNMLFGSLESEKDTGCDFESSEDEDTGCDFESSEDEDTGCDFELSENEDQTSMPIGNLTESNSKEINQDTPPVNVAESQHTPPVNVAESQYTPPVKVADIRHTPPVKINVKVLSKFNHLGAIITCLHPCAQNKVLVFCQDDYKYYFLNMKGKVLNQFRQEFIINDCVTFVDNTVLVTDVENKTISKLRLSGEHMTDINLALLYPLCLCKSRAGNILVTVCDAFTYEIKGDSRRMVMRIDFNGTEIEAYEYHDGKRLFTKAIGIDENTNGDICVIDRYSKKKGSLVVLNKTGEFRYRYRGGLYQTHFDPLRVKCDIHGHMIVTDRWENKIHLINIAGELVQYLMTDTKLKHQPFSLVPTRSGLLWIGCWDGRVYLIRYVDQ